MRQLFFLRFAVALLPLVLLSGCLISEADEYTLVMGADGKSGTLTVVKRNMQSDAKDAEQIEKDFKELMTNASSDSYLLDQLARGAYVKRRSLKLENGNLVWRETLLFSDVSKLDPQLRPDDSVRVSFSNDDREIVSTSGTVVHDSSKTIALFPPHTAIYKLTTRAKHFAVQSDFAKRYSLYLKKNR